MTKLKCSLACCDYDRTRAIFDGRVAIEGCDVTTVALEPEESFVRAREQEFDITEQSFSTHAMLTAKGENPYVGVPVFVSRVFRHSGIYIRTDRGINGPPDLRGKTIGLPEYAMTASVWIRGMLQDDYGVKPADVRWRQGATDHPLPPLRGRSSCSTSRTATICRTCSPPVRSMPSSAPASPPALRSATKKLRGYFQTIARPSATITAGRESFPRCMSSLFGVRLPRPIHGRPQACSRHLQRPSVVA